ncbi:MAG: glycosyltransferase [Paracoccaceae bacterium]|nr:glycosyltransferase [Paracoccaceae bacterium]
MAPPLRILHVCDKLGVRGSTIHGVTRLLSWWLTRFDETRHHVDLLVLQPWDHSADFLVERGVRIRCVDIPKAHPKALTEIRAAIRKDGYDILHLHGYSASNYGRIAARLTGIPAIVHEHFVDPKMPRRQSVADRVLAGLTTRGIGVSHSVVEFMATKRFIPRRKLMFVPNGAPLADFTRAGPDVTAKKRAELGLPEGATVIGSIGRLDIQKGLTHLVEALPRLAEAGHTPWVVLVGDGPQRGPLEARARALGVADRVIFAGFAADTRPVQSLFDIQAFPSLFEGTPLALFEAMTMGLPIVASAVDGLAEVLVDDATAALVPPADPAALATALARFLDAPEAAARLGTAAAEAAKGYDISVAVERLAAVYDDLAGSRG